MRWEFHLFLVTRNQKYFLLIHLSIQEITLAIVEVAFRSSSVNRGANKNVFIFKAIRMHNKIQRIAYSSG